MNTEEVWKASRDREDTFITLRDEAYAKLKLVIEGKLNPKSLLCKDWYKRTKDLEEGR